MFCGVASCNSTASRGAAASSSPVPGLCPNFANAHSALPAASQAELVSCPGCLQESLELHGET